MMSEIFMNAIMLSVIMLSVLAPFLFKMKSDNFEFPLKISAHFQEQKNYKDNSFSKWLFYFVNLLKLLINYFLVFTVFHYFSY